MGETVISTSSGRETASASFACRPLGPGGATVRALEATETLSLSHAAFDELRRKEPAIDQFLLVLLATQVNGLNERLREAYFEPVDTRVLRCLPRLRRGLRQRRSTSVAGRSSRTRSPSMVGATPTQREPRPRDLEARGPLARPQPRSELLQVEEITRRAR